MNRMIRQWWDGKLVENDPHSPLIFLNHVEHHWAARAARAACAYARAHHQWLIGTALAVIGLWVALHKL